MKFRIYAIYTCCLLLVSTAVQAQNMYEDKAFQTSFITECTNGASKDGAFTPDEAATYCNCAFEKMKAKNLNLDDIKRMQDPSSDAFKEIVLPCVEEAKGTAKKGINNDSVLAYSNNANADNIPVINLSESETESAANTQNVAGILSSSNDVFQSNASFQLSSGGYHYRGYTGDRTNVLINGISMNDAESGQVLWNEWGGLNDMFRGRQTTVGLAHSTFTFGNLGGALMFDSRAGHLFKGLNAGYAITNQRYRNRLNASYVSGFLKGNWAVAGAFVRRWAEKGYEPGTYYDGYSYFFSVEKLIKNTHSISFTTFGAPTRSARAAYSTKEMQTIANNRFYNPAWGYQNGQIRNANETRTFIPVFILTYEGKFSPKTNLIASGSYQFGTNKYSGLDWYNAQNPSPDYYKNLPSLIEDPEASAAAKAYLQSHPEVMQIQWDRLYDINRNVNDSVVNANGSGQTVHGKWSRYILADRVEQSQAGQFNAIVNHTIDDHFSVNGGLSYQYDRSRFYKQVRDLLGGDFFVNVNQFAERDFAGNDTANQYNLDQPNEILYVGDKYGYDYYSTLHKASAWGQGYIKYNHIEGYLGANISDSYFWRTGNVTNGLFPTDSKGDSKKINSFNYGVKGGLQGKINGRNYLYANAMYQTIAPTFRDAFVSPNTRNVVLPGLKSEKVYSVEAGYIYKAPRLSIKANFFYTQFYDGIQNYTYFHDDYRTNVNYSLTGVSKRHLGGELGANWDIWKGISASFVANVAKYTYTSRPSAYVTRDNNSQVLEQDKTIYLKDFNVGRGPQMAYSLGLRYRSPQFWNVGLNLNYFDWMYVDVSPARRVTDAIVGIDPTSPAGQSVLGQEKLKGQFTMDLRGGYSLYMNKMFRFKAKQRFYLQINWTISNITNNKNFILYGDEQLRFDFAEGNVDKFATKYKYARGIGYFVSLNFRMQ